MKTSNHLRSPQNFLRQPSEVRTGVQTGSEINYFENSSLKKQQQVVGFGNQFLTEPKTQRRKIIMLPPDFYEIIYNINEWTETAIKTKQIIDTVRAKKQWDAIVNFYLTHDIDVQVVQPKPGLPELTFLGDSIFLFNDHAIISNFKNSCRQPEAEFAEGWAINEGYKVHKMPESVVFEGNAMCIRWHDTKLLMGFGERTSIEAADYIGKWLGVQVIPLKLVQPYFHFDVALFPLSKETLVIHESAFTRESIKKIYELVPNILKVNEKEAKNLALNCIRVENDVLFSSENPELQQKIEKLGYKVHVFDTELFSNVGGGVKCLSLENYFQKD